ncbi:alpha/beta hydrolase [Pedobacter kyungheensis]|uniref:Alpha/beta hydrolase n=2 Tax=Pedobacter kyungheensis TaxID=1069985 RepID=A0A0C1FTW6_9SPHI|nr:alpha/beta hydrolase [Pedobacter kyungheensis]
MKEKVINGMVISYSKKYADRPTLVFLHDSLGCIELWRDFPEKLAEATKCNLVIYDRLGYGKSSPMAAQQRPTNYLEIEADILNNLLIELEIENAILFGHSDGGSIALIGASKYPTKIKAVIAEAAHIFVEEITLKGIYVAIEKYRTTNLAERLARYHGDKVESLFNAWTKTWTRNDYRDWNIEHFLTSIRCPLLIIQGEADEYGTLAQVEKTIDQVSGKPQKYIIPDIGHTPHKEVPELVLESCKDFIIAYE